MCLWDGCRRGGGKTFIASLIRSIFHSRKSWRLLKMNNGEELWDAWESWRLTFDCAVVNLMTCNIFHVIWSDFESNSLRCPSAKSYLETPKIRRHIEAIIDSASDHRFGVRYIIYLLPATGRQKHDKKRKFNFLCGNQRNAPKKCLCVAVHF